jgi:hypothetical protein
MKNTATCFVFFIFFCIPGCARPGSSSQDLSKIETQNWKQVYASLTMREMICHQFPQNDQFYVSYAELLPPTPSKNHLLPYPIIDVEVHFPLLKPMTTYFVYCPMTGCPHQPEFFMEIKTNEEGTPFPAQVFDKFQKFNIKIANMPIMVTLYGNPGYCSDWYLMTTNPFSAMHTTFTYKPISVSSPNGQTLTINKKEPGGNYLHIELSKFPPHKQLRMISCSEGESIFFDITTKDDGSYELMLAPQVVGHDKGIDRLTISDGENSLEASCDWDMSTLKIKRVQPPSPMWPGVEAHLNMNNFIMQSPNYLPKK